MTMKSRILIGLLLAAPAAAHAVGLGDIHLGSGLNQPLTADIELLGATPEELTQLRAAVASREIFARYGIDRPAFLSGLTFKVARDGAGRNVLSVHSADAVGEPFVTFLVELSWPRGHLIREYTVLLDPPVFESTPTAAPAMAAPVSGASSAPASGTIERAPTEPVQATAAAVAAPTPRPAPAPSPSSPTGGEYTVVPNDALSVIVRRQGISAPADVNRMMIATFRANPAAFDGNINRLRRGAVLRIPPESEWAATDAHEAAAEVSRQVEAWRARTGAGAHAAGSGPARLKLVVPKETTGKDEGSAKAAPAPAPAPRNPAAEKAREDARRLLEFKNAELARVQQQQQAKAAQKPAVPPTPVPAPVPAKPAVPAPAPVAAKPAPAPATPVDANPAEAKPAPKKSAPLVAAEPGLLEGLFGDNGLYYAAIGVLVALGGGLFGYRLWRRRRDASDLDEVLQPHAAAAGTETDPSLDSQSMLTAAQRRPARDDIVVEEADDTSGEYTPPPFKSTSETQSMRRPDLPSPPVDSRLTAESSIGLDQADPLAEADFHMAYGLYDQAADIVRLAIDREPERRDLQLKLLEVYFVWGNKDAFLEVARTLARGRDHAPAAEWDKVAIMGRQIAADDPLFSAARDHATSGADIDLDLDSGATQGVDLELLGDAAMHTGAVHHDGVDLDLGSALAAGDPATETGESPTIDPDRFDLLLEAEPGDHGGATQELPARADAPTVEQPQLHRSAFEEAPTVEMPGYESDSTLMQKLDAAGRHAPSAADPTAEINIEDLGVDTGTLGSTATATALEGFGETDHPSLEPSDAATLVAGLDAGSRSLLGAAGDSGTTRIASRDSDSTKEMPRPTFRDEATQLAPRVGDAAPTELLPSFDEHDVEGAEIELSSSDLDLDLDELARALENDTVAQPRRDEVRFSTDVFATGIHKAPVTGMDLDVGAPLNDHREPTVTERMPQDLDLPELEPVTLSEVGTKLDLARAYMDMGDPDGARSILQEVMSEGSASQKVEAQRLIETLPR